GSMTSGTSGTSGGPSPPPTWPHLQLCYLQPPPV
nr:Chain B, KASH5 [Homo sapiens]